MRVRAYALIRDSEAARCLLRLLAKQGFNVSWLSVGGLAAIFALEPVEPVPRTVAGALEHARVIAELHSIETILPLRYGTSLSGPNELENLLRLRHGDYLAALDAVAGCHEFGVRLSPVNPGRRASPSEADDLRRLSGTAYLRRCRERIAACERDCALLARAAERYQSVLRPLVVKSRSEESSPREECRVCVDSLVLRELAEPFLRAAAALPELPGVRFQVSGPWAPYQFARDFLGQESDQARPRSPSGQTLAGTRCRENPREAESVEFSRDLHASRETAS